MTPADDLRALIENQRLELKDLIKRVAERSDAQTIAIETQLVEVGDRLKRLEGKS